MEGLGSAQWEIQGLETIVREIGHTNRKSIESLQNDCEGYEFVSMPPLFDLIAAQHIKAISNQIHLSRQFNHKQLELQVNDLVLAFDRTCMRVSLSRGAQSLGMQWVSLC
mmetsp:Transcript_8601/g.20702  ORF Transcript_8601/g.20702 Transcript_8601/m.20702 type:complete len:110 (-) Transcript_8601:1070-1399(-)